jgi:hypothetical protein
MRHHLIRRLEALICTGSPGLYRVITFFAVQHIYSLAELGHTASSMAIAQMAGFFTAIGWATLILVRLPGAANGQAAIDTFYPLVSMAALTTMAVTLCSIALALTNVVRFDLWAFIALLWGWTAYQVARHYFVAHKRYRIAVIFDMGLITGSGLSLWVCERSGLSSSYGLAIALGAIAVAMFVAIGAPSRGIRLTGFDVKGLQFGLTNFLSGGIALVFIPAATMMCGASFSGLLSLLASVTAVGLLLPRAISMAQLPDLAKRKSARLPLDDTLRIMRRSIGWSNGVVLVINGVLVVGLTSWQMREGGDRVAVIFAGMLLAVQCAAGVMGMANSSVMMAFEKGGIAARINVGTTAIFATLFALCAWFGGQRGFLLVLVSAVAVTILRNRLIRTCAIGICHEYALQSRSSNSSEMQIASSARGPAQ